MNPAKSLLLANMLAMSVHGLAHAAEPYLLQKLVVGGGYTAVVAEGELEPRSTGSYSVRLYSTKDAQPGDDTVFFSAGLVRPRDGEVAKVFLAKLDGKGPDSLVVTMQSAGSGAYLSADAFQVGGGRLALRTSVSGLAAQADPVAALCAALRRRPSRR